MKEIFKEYKQNKTKKKLEISNLGNLKVNGVLYELKDWGQPYYSYHSIYIHRMVAETFIGNPDNLPYIDHIDGNSRNNKVTNLRFCTPSQNRLNPISVQRLKETNMRKDIHENRVNVHKCYCQEHPEGVFFHKGHIPWNKHN